MLCFINKSVYFLRSILCSVAQTGPRHSLPCVNTPKGRGERNLGGRGKASIWSQWGQSLPGAKPPWTSSIRREIIRKIVEAYITLGATTDCSARPKKYRDLPQGKNRTRFPSTNHMSICRSLFVFEGRFFTHGIA